MTAVTKSNVHVVVQLFYYYDFLRILPYRRPIYTSVIYAITVPLESKVP